MSTFRSLYTTFGETILYKGQDYRVKNMKFRVPLLYFLSSVFVCVSMLVPSGLFVVRVGMWACLVLISLFATVLFLFSLADVQRSDPEITMKQKIIREKEGKVKRIKTINESRMDIIGEMPQLRAMLDIRVFLSALSGG